MGATQGERGMALTARRSCGTDCRNIDLDAGRARRAPGKRTLLTHFWAHFYYPWGVGVGGGGGARMC